MIETGGRLLVVFDGHCGLCTGAVRWLLRRDGEDRLRFAASESPEVAGLLARHGMDGVRVETILVVRGAGSERECVLLWSDAVTALLGEIASPWPAVGMALNWIPRAIRDLGYRLVARWRYRIWGRLESCPVPTAEERKRFL
jgi:predicted DCC family thiol-disulfide oxidoreductase YuxK